VKRWQVAVLAVAIAGYALWTASKALAVATFKLVRP
jgi:hypothetical protein